MFLDDLRARGHQLTINKADDPSLSLKLHGEFQYDNLVLFSPASEEFGGTVDVPTVLEFVDSGRNVFVAVTSEVGEPVREIASESGVNFDTESNAVIDHMSYEKRDFEGDHTLVVSDTFHHIPVVFGKEPLPAPVLFEGIGASLDPENKLVRRLISGSPTAYSGNAEKPINDKVEISGTNTVLMAVLQARNNARMVFSGSLKFFSNEFYTSSVTPYPLSRGAQGGGRFHQLSANRRTGQELTKWCFGERGLLRAVEVEWRGEGTGGANASTVRMNERVSFSMRVEEWRGEAQKWIPFRAEDIQLEFVLLQPYIRITLQPESTPAGLVYRTSFITPDQHGVFKLRVNYHRTGYGSLLVQQEVVVRPDRHDEFDRFLLSALPYYVSAFSMLGGTIVLAIVLLFHRPAPLKAKET